MPVSQATPGIRPAELISSLAPATDLAISLARGEPS
jgi:hypothetical protein